MNFKKLVLSFTLASAAVLGTGVAHAVCTTYGRVAQVYTNGGTTTIYLYATNLTGLPTYAYYFTTTDAEIANVFNTSLHGIVYISGNAASCPTGAFRYGGVASFIYAN
jgi:hypothetical protein